MKLGLIGNDTSHVDIFSAILHDSNNRFYIPNVKITGFIEAYSEELEISINRASTYKEILLSRGIVPFDDVELLNNEVDGWLICTVNGRNHEEWFTKLAPFGKPIYIDKPFTLGTSSAERMVALAERYSTPFFTASSLRFSEEVTPLLGKEITKIYAHGPLPLQVEMPGYYWYGIHSLEWIEALLPYDLKSIDIQKTEKGELLTLYMDNGSHVVFDSDNEWHDRFGGTVFAEDEVINIRLWESNKPYYVSLVEHIIQFMETKQSPISSERMVKMIKWIEEINNRRMWE